MSTYYAILGPDRMPCHGGVGQWPSPGEWREEAGPLRVGRPGMLHLLRVEDLPCWLTCPGEIWEAEAAGPVEVGIDRIETLRARLVRRVGVLTPSVLADWAEECASSAAAAAPSNAFTRAASRAASRARTAADAEDARTAADAAADAAAFTRIAVSRTVSYAAARRWQGERLLELIAKEEEQE